MALVPCPSCGAKFDVGTFAPGKKLRCSKCKEVFAVPAAAPEPEPVPAAVSKKETRTSFRKKSSSVGPKPSPPPASEAQRRPPSSKSLKAADVAAAEPPGDAGETKEKSKAKLALIGVIVLLVAGGAYVATSGGDDEGAAPETYDQKLAKTPSPTPDDHAKLALWCLCKEDMTHAELHLDKALAGGSKAKQLKEAAEKYYWRKRLMTSADDVDLRLDLAERCGKLGLDVYLKTECNRVLAVDKKNDRANKILGSHVETGGGTGGDGDWERELAAKKAREEEDKRILAGLDPWHHASYKYHIDVRNNGLLGKDFTRLDDKPPFSIFVETTDAFDGKEVAKKYQDALMGLWEVFQKELGGKAGVQLDKRPFFVNVFASRARYDQQAEREQMFLRPDGFIKRIEEDYHIFTWSEGDVNKPYLWHDGFHVLFATAAWLKSGSKPSAWWINDGLALAFEAAAKAGRDTIVGIDEDRLGAIQQELRQDQAKRLIFTVSALAGKTSNDVLSEIKNIQGSQDDIFQRQKKGEALFAQAWSLVAYLLSSAETRGKLEAYVESEWMGKGGLSSFTEAFGDASKMEERWKAWVEKPE